jgi:hypothetical protein
MPWYRAGTVSVVQNSNAVTGSGTSFIANSRVGDAFLGPDGRWYEVTNIASDTAMSISPNYQGPTNNAGAYALAPLQGYVKASADALRALVNTYGAQLAALGTTGNYDILPVAKGGTGANSAAQAAINLGLGQAGLKNVANTWTPQQTFSTPPLLAGAYGGIQISNNAGVQLSQMTMDWGGSVTTLYLDFYYNMIFRNSSNGYPVIATFTPTGNFELKGFTKQGEQAPAVKQKLLTGVCSSAGAGGIAPVAHGLTSSKILGIQALVQTADANQFIGPGSDYAGYTFTFIFGATNINVINGMTNFANLAGKPFRLLVTYTE